MEFKKRVKFLERTGKRRRIYVPETDEYVTDISLRKYLKRNLNIDLEVWIINNYLYPYNEYPICPVCGAPSSLINIEYGFTEYCNSRSHKLPRRINGLYSYEYTMKTYISIFKKYREIYPLTYYSELRNKIFSLKSINEFISFYGFKVGILTYYRINERPRKSNVRKRKRRELIEFPFSEFRRMMNNYYGLEDLSKVKGTSLNKFIYLYGSVEGPIRWNNYKEKLSRSHTLEGFKEKYGDEEGEKRWNKFRNKISESTNYSKILENNSYEDAVKIINSIHELKSYSQSLPRYIEIYGDEGEEIYNEINKRRSNFLSKDYIINKFGEEYYYKSRINGSGKGTKVSFLSSKTKKKYNLKSTYESRYAAFLDICDEVDYYEYEREFLPCGIKYEFNGKIRTYFPDFKVKSIYDTITIVEVKPEYLIDNEEVQAKMKALNDYIKENNLDWNTAWISEKDLDALESGRYTYKTILGDIIYTNETLKI